MMLLLTAFCVAEETAPHVPYVLTDDYGNGTVGGRHFDFAPGYTKVTLYNFVIKITAEQRFSDKQLLVVVLPNEQGASFNIQKVQIGRAPHFNLQGPVAKVTGVFIARANMRSPIRTRMTVPVQIAPVFDYTVSPNEALIQGNQFYQEVLPNMVTGNMP